MDYNALLEEIKSAFQIIAYFGADKMNFRVIPIYKRTLYKLMTNRSGYTTNNDINVSFLSEDLFNFLKKELDLTFHTELMCDDVYREIYCSQSFTGKEIFENYLICIKKLEYDIIIQELD